MKKKVLVTSLTPLFVVALLAFSVLASIPVQASSSTTTSPTGLGSGFKLKGQAPAGTPILVTFALPLRNVGELESLLTQVSDPSSTMYRHFLTPAQVKADFLPTAQFSSLSKYLKEAGFVIESTALDSVIVAQGTTTQLESAFNEGVNVYSNGTFSYYADTGSSTFDGAYVYASNATFLYTRPENVVAPHTEGNVTFTSGAFSAKDLQKVYNATSLYALGDTGAGRTIGILDYYGSPTIASDLRQFDQEFGIPNSNFTVTPVGPYDPNLGVSVGWSPEVSIDVEFSHAMAPGASIDLYVANGALPLAVPLASIVQADNVTTLSQSFGTPEWYYSLSYYYGGPAFVALNALIPDQYYALGSLEGISFLAASGDGGGSGYSSGPEGNLIYPSSSPFVTSVGGTQTYISNGSEGAESFTQTAWSSIGYVGSGAGGGGVSILEPKPWYQANQSDPKGYPNGRLDPDVSLQAGLDPAVLIVVDGHLAGYGGTSVASPLMAGLLTLLSQSAGGGLGLVNPFLYQVGNDPGLYAKAFDPITTGYTTPWTASYGYNLATGWGAPDIAGLASILNSTIKVPQLSIEGEILNASQLAQIDYTPGQQVTVNLEISTSTGAPVTSGTFSLSLQTLAGTTAPSRISFDRATGNWTGSITVGKVSGITDVFVSGTSGGVRGEAVGDIYTGYLGTIIATDYDYYSVAADPWTWSSASPLSISVVSTDLNGNPAPNDSVTLSVEPYSLSQNSYTNQSAIELPNVAPAVFQGNLTDPAPAGPLSLVLGGDTYGYAPAVYGIWLQNSYVYPEVAAEPGAVAPGQSLTIIAAPIAPVNVYFNTALETGTILADAVAVGSNVTAYLVSPSGATVSNATLYYQSCAQALRVCDGGADTLYGQLPVPYGASPGLYTVRLDASYGSYSTGGNVTGSFYGQVLVSGGMIVPRITISPSVLYEGEKAMISASIAYPNGTEVKLGEYTAVVYPEEMENNYTSIMHTEYEQSELVNLAYSAQSKTWVGYFTLPSPSNQGVLHEFAGSDLYYSGPYEAYVTGMTPGGVPTSSALSAQQGLFVQPYVLESGQPPAGQSSGLAFDWARISSPAALSGDLFAGNNTVVNTDLVISASQNDGSLIIQNSNVTLVGVSGGNVVAIDSTIRLQQSNIGSLILEGSSTATLVSSTYSAVSPALPSVTVLTPAANKILNGTTVSLDVKGSDVASVSLYLDGGLLKTFAGGEPSYTYSLNSTSLVDGLHVLTVVAQQKDGLSSSTMVSFSTDAKLVALQNSVNQLGLDVLFVLALGVIALLVALLSARRRPGY